MTLSFKHNFTSPKADGVDMTIVQPSAWNHEHDVTAAAGKILGRDSSGAGAVQELPLAYDGTDTWSVPTGKNFSVVDGVLSAGGTGAMRIPVGTTAQRPVAPSNGYTRYNTNLNGIETYIGAAWVLSVGGSGGSSTLTVSDTPPVSPSSGALWWNSSDGQLYVYYNDGTSSQWVVVAVGGSQAAAPAFKLFSAAGVALIGTDNLYDLSGGAFSLLLPTVGLFDGAALRVIDAAGSLAVLTVDGNGNTIRPMGGTARATHRILEQFSTWLYVWRATASVWTAIRISGKVNLAGAIQYQYDTRSVWGV